MCGGKLHTGRSRNDQCTTDMRLWMVNTETVLEKYVVDFFEVLIKRAKQ